jgi:hypothetical protein
MVDCLRAVNPYFLVERQMGVYVSYFNDLCFSIIFEISLPKRTVS